MIIDGECSKQIRHQKSSALQTFIEHIFDVFSLEPEHHLPLDTGSVGEAEAATLAPAVKRGGANRGIPQLRDLVKRVRSSSAEVQPKDEAVCLAVAPCSPQRTSAERFELLHSVHNCPRQLYSPR